MHEERKIMKPKVSALLLVNGETKLFNFVKGETLYEAFSRNFLKPGEASVVLATS